GPPPMAMRTNDLEPEVQVGMRGGLRAFRTWRTCAPSLHCIPEVAVKGQGECCVRRRPQQRTWNEVYRGPRGVPVPWRVVVARGSSERGVEQLLHAPQRAGQFALVLRFLLARLLHFVREVQCGEHGDAVQRSHAVV